MSNYIEQPVASQDKAVETKNVLGQVAVKPFYIWANEDCANKSDSFKEAKATRLALFNEGGDSVHLVDADGVEVVDAEIEAHEALVNAGYFAGARKPDVKPELPGAFMVNDPLDLDGYAIVGDDIAALILEARDHLIESASQREMSNYIEQTALSQDKPAGLRALNCAASLSNGLLTLEDGTSVELADLVDFVKGVASKAIPSSNDAEHDLLVEVIGEAGAVLNQSGVRRILSNYIDHPASGKTGTFAAKYDQHAERNGQSFTVLGAVDPSTYDADECGEMFTIRFADGVQIDAWPEEVESARVAQSPVDRLYQYGHNPT